MEVTMTKGLRERLNSTLDALQTAGRRITQLETELELLASASSGAGDYVADESPKQEQPVDAKPAVDSTIPTAPTAESESVRRDPILLFFAKPELCHRIFYRLSNQDLLRCSLVSKSWYKECRLALRSQRKSSSHVGTGQRPTCLDLLRLNNASARFRVPPFNGLHVNLNLHNCPADKPGTGPEDYYERLCKIQWENLTISWESGVKCWDCPALKMVRRILSNHGSDLRELELEGIPRGAQLFDLHADGEHRNILPRLKVCRLQSCRLDELLPIILIVAPSLEKTTGILDTNDLALLPLNRFNIVKEIHISEGRSNLDLLQSFAETLPQLERIEAIDAIDHCRSNVYYLEPVHKILVGSRNTLAHLEICAVELGRLMLMGLPVFDKLKTLTLGLSPQVIPEPQQERIQRICEKIKPDCHFKSLKTMRLVSHSCKCNPIDESSTVARGPARTKFPSLVTELKLEYVTAYLPIQYLAGLFPNVTQVDCKFRHLAQEYLQAEHQLQDWKSLTLIWKHWPELKSLRMSAEAEFLGKGLTLDPIFCGISYQEFLRIQKDYNEEELATLEIVPSRPGINFLKNLKELYLAIGSREFSSVTPKEEHEKTREIQHILTHVTGLLVFGRMPSLHVTLECLSKSFGAWNHLAPWAEVVYKENLGF